MPLHVCVVVLFNKDDERNSLPKVMAGACRQATNMSGTACEIHSSQQHCNTVNTVLHHSKSRHT